MAQILKEKILENRCIAPGIFKMKIHSEYTAANALPGQFINIKCREGFDALLRRPISICSVNRIEKTFDIVYQVKGKGTEYLSQMKEGDAADIIAPLGRPFEMDESLQRIAVVGGGIGIFPLLFLLQEKRAVLKSAFIGFRDKEYAVLADEFEAAAHRLALSTDDGSLGYRGLVTDLLEKDLMEREYDVIYTCGPAPMIRRTAEIADRHKIRCQVSLEQRMGCGIGACLVCACKTKLGDEWEYSHVCKDGPVFWSDEVIWDD